MLLVAIPTKKQGVVSLVSLVSLIPARVREFFGPLLCTAYTLISVFIDIQREKRVHP